ncbi:helix-turn-helix domain-containing protein [Streptomyces syringium]|uniref:helix-turn-helix domain-containing protein n=1 Tax=Streptomyces syringium TaxID=76729 RepID=UPI0036497937
MGDHVVDLWTHPRLVAAVASQDWAALLRTYRKLTGMSQTKLGELVGLVQPDVSDIERGRRRVTSVEVRQRIVTGLGIPPALLATVGERPETSPVPRLAPMGIAPDADLLARVTSAVGHAKRVDTATLDWLDRLLAEHRRAEDVIGSRPLTDVMHQQLRTVVDLHSGARGDLADRVVRLAAEHAQFLAWMAQDQADTAAALAWYDRAHEWALEAGDAGMAATTLSMKAHMAWSGGRGMRCVRLAETARWSVPSTFHLTGGLAALPDGYRRDKAWYRACLAHAAAGAGEAEYSLKVALRAIPDAAAVGRPHAWNELHVTAAALLRQRAPEGRHLVAALKAHD